MSHPLPGVSAPATAVPATVDVSIAELSADDVAEALRSFEAANHVTPATWLDVYRDRSGAVVRSASLYRTAALYALHHDAA